MMYSIGQAAWWRIHIYLQLNLVYQTSYLGSSKKRQPMAETFKIFGIRLCVYSSPSENNSQDIKGFLGHTGIHLNNECLCEVEILGGLNVNN